MDDWRDLKRMMKALTGVARLTIVYHLARQNEITVTALTNKLRLSQPLVSWHLRRLQRAGFVETHRVGRQVYCKLNLQRFQQCLRRLEGLIDPAMSIELPLVGAALIEADAGSEE